MSNRIPTAEQVQEQIVTVPASLLLEIREIIVACYTLSRNVERLEREIIDARKEIDRIANDNKPIHDTYRSYLTGLQDKQNRIAADSVTANAQVMLYLKKALPYIIAGIMGAGWGLDRFMWPDPVQTIEESTDAILQ